MSYTVKEISEFLMVSEEQVRRWCRNNKLQSIKYSKKGGYIIKENDFMDFLDDRPKYKKIFENYCSYDSFKKIKIDSLEKILEKKKQEILDIEKLISYLKDSY